jgi:hypothetical protein
MHRTVALAWFALVATAFVSQAAIAGPECRCRLFGEKIAVGTFSCIKGKLMQCLMFQNTPSWKVISEVCPMARQDFTPRTKRDNPADPQSAS